MRKKVEVPTPSSSDATEGETPPAKPSPSALAGGGEKPLFTPYIPPRIRVSVSINLDFAELAQWDSQRIQALMRGVAEIAQVAKARGETE